MIRAGIDNGDANLNPSANANVYPVREDLGRLSFRGGSGSGKPLA